MVIGGPTHKLSLHLVLLAINQPLQDTASYILSDPHNQPHPNSGRTTSDATYASDTFQKIIGMTQEGIPDKYSYYNFEVQSN